MAFQVYFPICEVASRLGTSEKTIQRLAESGQLGPVWLVAGKLRVGEDGLISYLDRHVANFSAPAVEMRRLAIERRMGRSAPPERGPFQDGVSARSQGELLRKLNAQEAVEEAV